MRAKTQEAEVEQADFDIIATNLRFVVEVFVVEGVDCFAYARNDKENRLPKSLRITLRILILFYFSKNLAFFHL